MQTLYANGTNCSYIEFVPDFSSRGFAQSCSFRAEGRNEDYEIRSWHFSICLACNGRIYYFSRKDTCLSRVSICFSPPANEIELESVTCARVTHVAYNVRRKFRKDKIYWPKQRFGPPFRTEDNFARAFITIALMIGIQLMQRVLTKSRIATLVKMSNVNGTSLEMAADFSVKITSRVRLIQFPFVVLSLQLSGIQLS